ncbi:hypothetical protein BG015_005237 [Linnemannia schmuckeri]|uniref:F-box domain-containing protein n=1 Tax=Linnemannia schmuckeri TaxID=64567 RepID=A0A9P5R8G2_9FUNG|nr:hypothetical protein BG015_005237 [Linnemannia schmuckeri]
MNPSTRPSRLLVLEPVYKRIPVEVWEQIFSYLYPSQLSRISMVNKNLNSIVSLLEVWSRMFAVAHGPKAHLRPLLGISKSKSYMMFMCSSSLHVCERCFAAIKCMRRQFGGDVGMEAYNESTKEYDKKTEARIRWYQLQE